jgi:molybdate transport system ATP-binding protein
MSVDVRLRHMQGAFALDVAFESEASGVTALFGPSGAGKTSIVHAIAGLVRPQDGRIAIGGRVLFDSGRNIDVAVEDRRIGLVFQEARLFPHMRVDDNLRFGWRRAAERASQAQIAHVVEMLGLGPLLSRHPARLSGGEKSRAALGRALLASPSLLLLDEPLAALDAARKAEILPYLERLRDEAKVPIVYVSHSADEVLRLADRVVLLDKGRVAGEGSVFDFAGGEIGELLPATGAVIDTRLESHDGGLSLLSFDGGRLAVARMAVPAGSKLRVRIRAEDVLLAREEPRQISANNVLAARIVSLREIANGQVDAHLACGRTRLVARITQASAARLALAPGQAVFAVMKSVILDPRALRGPDALE